MTRRVKSLVAAGLAAALSLGIGRSLVSTAAADDSGLGKLGATSYKEADYISNASLEGLRDYMGVDVSQLSAERFKSIVDRAVLVEPLTDENSNYQQKWRITWNLSEAQQPQQWPGDGAVPYNKSGFDDMSNPDYSLMVSQDLTILTDSEHTPHWTVYNRKEPNKAFASFDLPLWKTKSGNVKTVKNQYGESNTLKNMYYFGQYKDADGNDAPANWQDLAKACLAGGNTASEVSSQSDSPCGDYVEWLNKSGKSFAAGQSDLSDNSTRYVDGKSYERSLKQFNMFAQQIGGLQTFEWHTGSFDKSTENLGQIVTVEFTTQRTPWAGNGNEKVHRTFVAGHYKGNISTSLYEGTQFKYVETPEKDSDGDGLTDRFELGIGTCPFPKDSAEYNETPNCKGVADPTDTDGDGVPDGKEVKSQTPHLYDTGFKIEGTDPTVAPQKPSNPSDPTGHKGEKVTGKTRPYETVELYDLSTGAVIASTIADENGNYTLEPGRILSRTDGTGGKPKSFNKYGNNIQFASEEDEAARKPVMMDGGTPVPDGENHLVAVRVWSDGMDPLPGSEATRPQFTAPTGVLPSIKVDEKTPVQDPHHLTDDEKQKVKDDINKSVPGASDVVVNDDGSATVTIGGSQYTIPSQDLITTAPALPADPAHSSIGQPSKTTVPVSDGTSADGKTSFTVTLKDKNGKPVTDADNLTVTREDGKQVKPEIVNNGDGTYTVTVSSQEAGTSPLKVSVGDTEIGSTTPITFEQPAPAQPNIQVSTSHCSAVVADGKASCSVTITLTDKDGKVITDDMSDSVKLTASGPDGATATFSELKQNPDGTYTATMTSTKPGDFTVTATQGDEPNAVSASTTVTFVPGPLATVSDWTGLSSDDDPWVAGTPVDDVTVKVSDKNGNPLLSGTEVYVTVPGVENPVRAVVDENGVAHLDPFTPTKAGADGTISVYPSEDDAKKGNNGVATEESPATTAGAFNPATSEVSVSSGDKKVGDSQTVTISLKDQYDNPITDPQAQQDALKKLKVNASNGSSNATVGDFTPVEGQPGVFTVPVTATKPGDYTVTVSAGDTQLKNSPATVNFAEPQPSAEKTTFSADPSPVTQGYPVAVNGQVNDENGKPIAGHELTVVLPDGTKVPVKTDDNGYVVDKDGKPITFTAKQGGEVKLFDGTDTTGEPLKSATLTVNDPVIGSGSHLEVKPSDQKDPSDPHAKDLNPGDKATVDGTIVDENGKPIAGRELTVVLPDGTTVPAVTDKDGKIVGKDGQPIEFTVGDKDGAVKVYDGSDTSEPAKPVVTVPVNPVPVPSAENSSVSVSPQNPTKGDTVTVSGEVKDKNGNPMAGRDVTVVLPDGTRVPGVTNDKGEIVSKKDGSPITFVADKSGDMKLFDGTSADGDPLASAPVTVSEPKPATIGDGSSATVKPVDSQDSELNPGDKATVDGTIVDEKGKPIAGRELTVVLPDGTTVPAVTDKDGKLVGKDGQPITFTVGDKDGAVKVYDGSDTAEPAKPVLTAPVHVVAPVEPVKKADPEHSSVTVSPVNPNKGDTVVVSGVVKDSDGNPIAGRDVTVVLPDGTRVPGVTNDKGEIVSKDGTPITFIAEDSGDVKVFDGSSADGEPLVSATVTVSEPKPEVIGDDSSVSVKPQTPGDDELNPGDAVVVDGKLVDDKGKPIAGRELTVVLPDGTTVPAVTDKDGKIVGKDGQPITFTAGDKDGEVKVYDGSDTTGKPVLTAPVHVVAPVEPVKKADPEHSSVTVSPANPNKGETVVVSGVVKDSDGKPLAGREVTIVLPDGTEVPGTTDKDGKLVGKDGQPITFVARDSGDMKVLVDGDPLASAKLTVKDGSADNNGNNNGSNNGGKDNSGNNNGASDNAGKNNGKNNGNKGGAAAQNAQKSAQVLASTGAAVTAIVAVALAFVSFGMLALAARRRKDEE